METDLMRMTSALVFAGMALGAFSFGASAFPIASPVSQSAQNVIQVAEGCGRGEHREHGRCYPDRPHERICPPGWHWGPVVGRCVR
jgi:hypothetical protein